MFLRSGLRIKSHGPIRKALASRHDAKKMLQLAPYCSTNCRFGMLAALEEASQFTPPIKSALAVLDTIQPGQSDIASCIFDHPIKGVWRPFPINRDHQLTNNRSGVLFVGGYLNPFFRQLADRQ
jgi:hypothetical protein